MTPHVTVVMAEVYNARVMLCTELKQYLNQNE